MPPKNKKSKRARRTKSPGESDDSYMSENGSTRGNRASKSKRPKNSEASRKGGIESGIAGISDSKAPAGLVNSKKSEEPKEDLDKYCKMCDDGGRLLLCDGCGFSYCYDELPPLPIGTEDDIEHDTEHEPVGHACISVPHGYTTDPFTVFHCPECLTEHPGLPFDVPDPYTDIAEKAVSARIFGLCCGLNLAEEKTIPAILSPLVNSHWDSVMLPTASSLLPEEISTIFPELFGHIYYNGVPLTTAVVRVWAASQRARVHTDILLIEGLRGQPTVKKYRYGSLASRPYGVDLPAPWSFCKCAQDGNTPKWKRKDGKIARLHDEFLVRYKTTCNHAHIDLAIFTGNAYIREAAGAQVVIEDFDHQSRTFPLDTPDSIAMKPFLRAKGETQSKGA
ncbi:hypothetical protein RSAG8_12528, partial [Rhizoctonia solani AG-8 WAC10335]